MSHQTFRYAFNDQSGTSIVEFLCVLAPLLLLLWSIIISNQHIDDNISAQISARNQSYLAAIPKAAKDQEKFAIRSIGKGMDDDEKDIFVTFDDGTGPRDQAYDKLRSSPGGLTRSYSEVSELAGNISYLFSQAFNRLRQFLHPHRLFGIFPFDDLSRSSFVLGIPFLPRNVHEKFLIFSALLASPADAKVPSNALQHAKAIFYARHATGFLNGEHNGEGILGYALGQLPHARHWSNEFSRPRFEGSFKSSSSHGFIADCAMNFIVADTCKANSVNKAWMITKTIATIKAIALAVATVFTLGSAAANNEALKKGAEEAIDLAADKVKDEAINYVQDSAKEQVQQLAGGAQEKALEQTLLKVVPSSDMGKKFANKAIPEGAAP